VINLERRRPKISHTVEKEKLVFDVVREYLDKNRVFDISNILSFIKSRFKMNSININIEGIELILKSLVEKNLLVEGSKLSRNEVLLTEKRNTIHENILKNPGTYLNKIIKEVGFSFNVVIWHLGILQKFNYVKKGQIENRTIYYSSDLEFKEVKIYYFYNSNARSKRIIEYLKINDHGVTKTELSSKLNMHINTVINLLENLEESNIISKQKEPNKILYFLNEAVFEII
jgi:predicted transcriptional regulator